MTAIGRSSWSNAHHIVAAQDPDLFDAAHFRLSRTEAVALDPQARLLLQVATEVRVQLGSSVPQSCITSHRSDCTCILHSVASERSGSRRTAFAACTCSHADHHDAYGDTLPALSA